LSIKGLLVRPLWGALRENSQLGQGQGVIWQHFSEQGVVVAFFLKGGRPSGPIRAGTRPVAAGLGRLESRWHKKIGPRKGPISGEVAGTGAQS